MSRSFQKHSHRHKKSGGGGGGSIFGLRLKFTTRPTKVHLSRPEKQYVDPVTGEEEDYLLVTEHYVRSARGGKGAGIRHGAGPCVCCAYTDPQAFDLEIEADAKLAKFPPKDQFVVAGHVEEPHHIVEEKGNNDKMYKNRVRCRGQKCKPCREGNPLVFGNRFYFGFSSYAWTRSLLEVHEGAKAVCRCGGICFSTEYLCPDEDCGEVVYDAASECDACGSEDVELVIDQDEQLVAECQECEKSWSLSVLENEALAEDVGDEIRCPHCGVVDIPEPVVECTEEECDGDPHDIFDCQMILKKESDDQMASLVVSKWKIRDPDSRLFDPEHQSESEGDGAKDVEVLEAPLDLTLPYKDQSSGEQAKLLGMKDPFAPQGGRGGSGVKNYVRGDDEDLDDDDVPF